MTTPTESIVALKYQMITSDDDTWHLCETYPEEVRIKWAWRCAADVEHLADGHPEAMNLIAVAKKFRDGLASKDELKAARAAHATSAAAARGALNDPVAARAAVAATAATSAAAAATAAIAAAFEAAHRAAACEPWLADYKESWAKYLQWLKEELIKYEEQE